MTSQAFDDRAATLDGQPEQLAELSAILGSSTRIAVLAALVQSKTPLHINEVARRVGVDASPVRTHLELLSRVGLVREVKGPVGRERRFETRLTNVRLVLEGVNRHAAPEKDREKPKTVVRLEKRLAGLSKDAAKVEEKAARLRKEIAEAWAEDAAKRVAKEAKEASKR
ncbi:MAG: helix-turn-helix domain-containing protein [Thermoplasmatota archaeon]